MRELRKIEQKLRKLRRARPLKGGVSMRCRTDEELLRWREEAEEAAKQRSNRKRANKRRQRRRHRCCGKENKMVDTADKGIKEGEQVELVRLKGPLPRKSSGRR